MIYEIRNYHFRPDLFEAYKAWAKAEALPYLGTQLDILGFWTTSKHPPEIGGAPQDDLGTANITWIIRWRDMAHREDAWPRLQANPEWQAILGRVPGGMASYLRLEAKFADSLL